MAAAAGPNPANIVTGPYTASGIVFAKATDKNLEVAKSINAADTDLTDVFKPVTLANGKIVSASTSSKIIQGVDTIFTTQFFEGEFMFYYTAGAQPVLLGKIESVNGNSQITLSENSPVTISETPTSGQLYPAYCGKTDTLIGVNESIIMRVPVVPITPTQIWLPNWNAYRITANEPSSYNLTTSVSMSTYSQINNPQEAGTPINIDFTIQPIWDYAKTNIGGFQYVFSTPAQFPNYAYAVLNPYGNSLTDSMPANTLYKFFVNQEFPNNGLQATTNYPVLFLTTSGY